MLTNIKEYSRPFSDRSRVFTRLNAYQGLNRAGNAFVVWYIGFTIDYEVFLKTNLLGECQTWTWTNALSVKIPIQKR
jgi:hypothetical protein